MKTITCPTCKREHALFYTQHPGKRTLNYICDRIPREVLTDTLEPDGVHYVTELHYATGMREVEFRDGLDIPVRWSPRYKAQEQNKHQPSLL